MNRREFIKNTGCLALCAGAAGLAGWPVSAWAEDTAPKLPGPSGPKAGPEDERFVRPAMFWEKIGDGRVQCRLCPRECRVPDGGRGHCGVRENRGGEYFTLVYGRVVADHNDPIEKKPLFHYRPGTMVYSIATAGCNIHCKFCQNWQISQFKPEELPAEYLPPEKVVERAKSVGSPSIAFTYSEPTIFYEFIHDTAKLAFEQGLRCVVISNGFTSPEAVRKLSPYLGAYKVDLKAFNDDFYREYCQARLDPVLTTIRTLHDLGQWVELVNLVLPTANDAEKDVRGLARWVVENVGPMTPVHFTRFHPMYKMLNLPPTPVKTLVRCHEIAREEGLKYPYVGNVAGLEQENTFCHNCGQLLIRRTGLWAVDSVVENGRCPRCQTVLPGVWS